MRVTQNEVGLDRKHLRLVLAQAALGGVDDLSTGRVLREAELDRLFQSFLHLDRAAMEAGLTRQQALRRTSDDYLRDVQSLSVQGAIAFAYQPGCVALLAALPDDIAARFVGHLNATAAADGALRLGLSEADTQLAHRVANDYYAPDLTEHSRPAECIEWAGRVRSRLAW